VSSKHTDGLVQLRQQNSEISVLRAELKLAKLRNEIELHKSEILADIYDRINDIYNIKRNTR
jgi:hypothetical protein